MDGIQLLQGANATLDLREIRALLRSAKDAGASAIELSGAGEPLLDKRSIPIITRAKELGLITNLATNGSVLNEGLLCFLEQNDVTLTLSLDTLDAREYAVRSGTGPGMLAKVMANIVLAQKVYSGTSQVLSMDGEAVCVYRLAVHATLRDGDGPAGLDTLAGEDTLLSLSCEAPRFPGYVPTASSADAEHITRIEDGATGRGICGFFRHGLDINYDGQIMLDSHLMDSVGLYPNARDFGLDVPRIYRFCARQKEDYLKSGAIGTSFCPVRSPGSAEYLSQRKQLKRGVVRAILEGSPLLKYSYIGFGALNYLRLLQERGYYTYHNEMDMVRSYCLQIGSRLQASVRVLGAGDGSKIAALAQSLRGRPVTLVDISPQLLELSKNALDGLGCRLSCQLGDFERHELGRPEQDTTFLLLGNTLGNLEDPQEFLMRLRASCPGGNILLGLELVPDTDSGVLEGMVAQYDQPADKAFLCHPLSVIGLRQEDGEVVFSFDAPSREIRAHFEPSQEGRMLMQTHGLEPGRILLGVSKKYGRQSFERLVTDAGYSIGEIDLSRGTNHLIELVPA